MIMIQVPTGVFLEGIVSRIGITDQLLSFESAHDAS